MHRLTSTLAAAAAGIFALLLVIYLFAGGKSREGKSDQPSGEQVAAVGPAAQCSSQASFDLIKRELIRQAAEIRGHDETTFREIASSSFIHLTGAKRLGMKDAGTVACVGRLRLYLPPDLSVAGGQRSLASNVAYAIRPRSGSPPLVTIRNANAIIGPLSTLAQTAGSAGQEVVMKAPTDREVRKSKVVLARDRLQPLLRQIAPVTALAPVASAPVPVRVSKPASEPAPAPVPVPVRTVPSQAPPPSPQRHPIAAAPLPNGSPSFNCRYARTRGEISVCGNSSLSRLDRQMSVEYNRAVSAADPGKRLQLQRSRGLFLRFRNSCTSDACLAAAYLDRMRQIDDIMNERWSPR